MRGHSRLVRWLSAAGAAAATLILVDSSRLFAEPTKANAGRAETWEGKDPVRVATELADTVRVSDDDFLVMVSEALREASRFADSVEDSEWGQAIDGKPSISILEIKRRGIVTAVLDHQLIVNRLTSISESSAKGGVHRELANLVLHRLRRVATNAAPQSRNFARLREVVAERESFRSSFVKGFQSGGIGSGGGGMSDGGSGMAAQGPEK